MSRNHYSPSYFNYGNDTEPADQSEPGDRLNPVHFFNPAQFNSAWFSSFPFIFEGQRILLDWFLFFYFFLSFFLFFFPPPVRLAVAIFGLSYAAAVEERYIYS